MTSTAYYTRQVTITVNFLTQWVQQLHFYILQYSHKDKDKLRKDQREQQEA